MFYLYILFPSHEQRGVRGGRRVRCLLMRFSRPKVAIYDEMDQSAYFSCLDFASAFSGLTIHEADRYLIAFWRCGRKTVGVRTL